MSETLTRATIDVNAAVPDYPMVREAGCPFAPPPALRELSKPVSRVRIWDGSTPWLVTGYEEARDLLSDSRVSVDDRRSGFPHWNEGTVAMVDKRPPSVFTRDAEEHTRYRRMFSKPFTFNTIQPLRPPIHPIP